jgi:hypothetical protein
MSTEAAHKALRKFAKRMQTVQVITGSVKAVNGYLCDVEPSDGGPVIFDVRLKVASNAGEEGCYAIPRNGSRVRLVMLDGQDNAWAVTDVETIESWVLHLDGGATIEAKPNGAVAINGDQYGGLVKVEELRQELAKVNTFLTTLRQAIASAPVVGGDGGASMKAYIASQLGGLQIPTYNTIESTRTKHGGV